MWRTRDSPKDETGLVTAQNVFSSRGIVARVANEQTLYHINDAHGDVIGLWDEFNNPLDSVAYDPYGNRLSTELSVWDGNMLQVLQRKEEGVSSPFGYCGEYTDAETGFVYLRARYYDTQVGRFTQQDGWEFADLNDLLSLNLYVYCGNNPITFTDPSGHLKKGDNRFENNNPIVYQALLDLTKSWENLDALELGNPDIDIKALKAQVNNLANIIRAIGDQKIVATSAVTLLGRTVPLRATELVLFDYAPTAGWSAVAAGADATKISEYIYGDGYADGGNANAFRHALWNAEMVINCGGWFAETWANAHEFGAPDNFSSRTALNYTLMDLANNAKGRQVAKDLSNGSVSSAAYKIISLIDKGNLTKIVNGRLAKTDSTGKIPKWWEVYP